MIIKKDHWTFWGFPLTLVLIQAILISTPYNLNELGILFHSLSGQLQTLPELYYSDVLDFKKSILLYQLYTFFFHSLGTSASTFAFGLFFVSTALALWGIYSLLEKNQVKYNWAMAAALVFLFLRPLGFLSYGYHYKVGSAAASVGLVAFAIMTALLVPLFLSRFRVLVGGLLVLFAVHPLNAFLFLGFAGFWTLFFQRNLKQTGLMAGLGVLFLWITSQFYLGSMEGESQKILWNLIQTINGTGPAGAYFLPWLNKKTFLNEILIHVGHLFVLVYAQKRKWLDPKYIYFTFAVIGYSFLLCLLHYGMDLWGWKTLLATDISRFAALARPIIFVTFISIIARRFRETPQIGALSLLLFFSFYVVSIYSFFLFCAFLAFANLQRLRPFVLLWGIAIIAVTFIGIDENSRSIVMKSIDFTQNWQVYRLVILGALFASLFLTSRWQVRVPLIVVAALLGIQYVGESQERIDQHLRKSRAFQELKAYIHQRTHPDDLFLTTDQTFGLGAEYRPFFAPHHNISYGIYVGKLNQLSKEVRLAWGLDLANDAQVKQVIQDYATRGGFPGFLEDSIQNLSSQRIFALKTHYPKFKYVLLKSGQDLKNSPPELKQVFQNSRFTLFKVNGFNPK